ncbi:MAG: TonB-dependent receptor [Acidobacteriia bacterium]|nr:TonB-dependent receptor [Terriglobia bacterium]
MNGVPRRGTGSLSLTRLWLLLSVVIISVSAFAQSNLGAIAGTVLDPTGAVVPNAKITARDPSTGTTYDTVSSSAGSYRIGSVRPGTYHVTVSVEGFKKAELTGVIVQVGDTRSLDVHLQPGAVTESVQVLADAPAIQTESSEIGTVVTTKQVLELPLPLGGAVQAMRSPEAFVFLTPGTVGPGTGGYNPTNFSGSNGGTFESKITGGQNYATEVLLDGASTSRSENGSSFDETAPSVDALGEFKVFTSTLAPEMGRTTGGIESFTTKSGTNSFHGTAYDIFRNEDMDANLWFNNLQLSQTNDPATRALFQRPLDKQNDYGLTLGGPLLIPKLYNGRDKTFFFFSWEQYRQHQGGVNNVAVPTANERNGDFSELLDTNTVLGTNPCDDTPIYAGEIFDPATTQVVQTGTGPVECRTAFMNEPGSTGNVIPQNRWSTVGQNILSFYPQPQQTTGPRVPNFAFAFSYPILDTSMTIRVDQNIRTNHKLYFTYNSRDNTRLSTTPEFDNPAGAGRFQDFFTHYIRIGYDYAISPSMLNHLIAGYNRTNSRNTGAGVRFGKNWADELGITNTAATGSSGITFPSINVDDYTGMGDSVNGDTIDNGFRLVDSLSWIKGRHDYKFGADFRYQQYSPLNFSNTAGTYHFSHGQTAATPGTGLQTGDAIANILLGMPNDANLTAYSTQARWLSDYYALYFQDSFKLKPNLTLNYGLRWEVDVPRRASEGATSNLSLTTPNPGADGFPGALVFAGSGAGRNGNVNERWVNTWYKDFGPRVGFAWSPGVLHGRTVVRGGFGILYGFLLYADFGGFQRTGFQANPGFALNGFDPAFNLDSGVPSWTPPPNLDPTQLNYQGAQYLDPSSGRPPMINNWSIEVQHEITKDMILNVAYVGQHSTHLRTNYDARNSLTPNFLDLGTLLNAPFTSQSTVAAPYPSFTAAAAARNLITAQALVPFPQYFGFNTDGTLEAFGQSSYNALQVSLKRRFRDNLNLLVSYTYSKTLTDADAALPFFATLHGGGSAQNPFNLNGEKAISNQDVPHNLVISYIYELPFGKGKKFLNKGGVADRLVGGWQISGIHRYHSGQPLSFSGGTGIPAFAGTIRPDRVAGESLYSDQWRSGHFNPLTDPMFNAAAFTDPNAACAISCSQYTFGNVPRTTGEVRMPWYLEEDFNLLKRFKFTESKEIVLQTNAINIFNRHLFDRPPLNPFIGNFGFVNTANSITFPRRLQLKLEFHY